MTEPSSISDRLDEVLRLTARLTDGILDAQITGRLLPGKQAVALAKAARLLQDHRIERPPMLRQALHGLAPKADETEPAVQSRPAAEDSPGLVIAGLTRLVGAFRRVREPS